MTFITYLTRVERAFGAPGTSVETEPKGSTPIPATVAYPILTRKDPEQVEALANRVLPVEPTPGWLLKQENLDPVMASGVAFARKVDQARSSDVIAAIDGRIDAIRNSGAVALVEDTRDRSSTQP
jgi:hypothetical protein